MSKLDELLIKNNPNKLTLEEQEKLRQLLRGLMNAPQGSNSINWEQIKNKPYWLNAPPVSTTSGIIGSGTTGRIPEFYNNTLRNSTLIKSNSGLLTLSSSGNYTLTVPATGTAVLGSGVAVRLAAWADDHTVGASGGLTTAGDLIYMSSSGAVEVEYTEQTETTLENLNLDSGLEVVEMTITLPSITAGGVARITVNIWASSYSGFGDRDTTLRLRRSSVSGSILATHVVPPTADGGHEDNWSEIITDATPAATYVITCIPDSGGGAVPKSDYRYLKLARAVVTTAPDRLAIGSEDQFLRVASGVPAWETVSVITGVSDTASVDLTVTGSTLSAAVLAAGVDHNSLLNYAANRHFLQTDITNISTGLATGLVKVTTGTGALSIVTDNSANWDTAYGWGNHASAGYVPGARTITEGAGLAGNTYDLTANRTLAMGTPSTVTVSTTNSASGTTHAHAVTSSSNPGAAPRILASNASGYLRLLRIGLGMDHPFRLT